MVVLKISQFNTYQFKLPLREPLLIGKHSLTHRQGLIVEISDDKGHIALGEISPLPGLNREDMARVGTEIARVRSLVVNCELPKDLKELSGGFEKWLGPFHLTPSVRFGFEMAVLNLLAARKGIPLCRLISDSPRAYVTINGLLAGSFSQVIDKAGRLLGEGYTAFKLKVGRNCLEDDVTLATTVRNLIGGTSILRLDANRAWTVDHALAILKILADINIDYIEEPTKTFSSLRRLASKPGISVPIALDESLLEVTPEEALSVPRIAAIVLKPTSLGLERAVQLARLATTLGVKPVISSSFESGLGLKALSHIAASVNKSDIPVGLGTLDWFKEDLLVTPSDIEKGQMLIAELPKACEEIRQEFFKKP